MAALFVVAVSIFPFFSASAHRVVVRAVRSDIHNGFTRFVIETNHPVRVGKGIGEGTRDFRFFLSPSISVPKRFLGGSLPSAKGKNISSWRFEYKDGKTLVHFRLSVPATLKRLFYLPAGGKYGHRLVIDIIYSTDSGVGQGGQAPKKILPKGKKFGNIKANPESKVSGTPGARNGRVVNTPTEAFGKSKVQQKKSVSRIGTPKILMRSGAVKGPSENVRNKSVPGKNATNSNTLSLPVSGKKDKIRGDDTGYRDAQKRPMPGAIQLPAHEKTQNTLHNELKSSHLNTTQKSKSNIDRLTIEGKDHHGNDDVSSREGDKASSNGENKGSDFGTLKIPDIGAIEKYTLPRPQALSNPSRVKFIVVIDPGHGGIDPGTISPRGYQEKNITLAFAREIRSVLNATGRYDVVLTRSGDISMALRERFGVARDLGAHLFVSLHVDNNPEKELRGFSVYTLSSIASDAEARKIASAENRADALVGLDLPENCPETSNILIDLSQRDSMNRSIQMAHSVLSSAPHALRLPGKAHRFGDFAVLKAPDIPSVLIELGYLSNREDEKLLVDKKYQKEFAGILLKAIDRFFETNPINKD